MATVEDVRTAIATALTDIPGLHVQAKMQQVNPPCAVVEFDHIDYHDLMDPASSVWHMTVTVLVSTNDVVAAQTALDAYLSPDGDGSIREALEADPTLDSVVEDVIVRTAQEYQAVQIGGESFVAVVFDVEART